MSKMQKPLPQIIAEAPVLVAPPAGWPLPIPLEAVRLENLPVELLPAALERFSVALAQATETPIEMAVLLVLAIIAAAVAGRCQVRLGSEHCEPLNLFVMAVMEPGNRKSAVIGRALRPLLAWERLQAQLMAGSIREAEVMRDIAEADLKALRDRARKADPAERLELIRGIEEAIAALPAVPVFPRLWAADVTPEQLAVLLADHGERMAVFSDEAGILGNFTGRYAKGEPNLDVILQGYSASPMRVDRRNGTSLSLVAPTLTIGITPQPAVLERMDATMIGRGLLDRFLFVVPPSKVGYRTLEDRPIPPGIEQGYNDLVMRLLDLPQDVGPDGRPRPHTFSVTPEARAEFHAFSKMVETAMQPGGQLEYAKGWASKLPGNVGRLAGLVHVAEAAERPWDRPVTAAAMQAAVGLGLALIPHAKVAYGLVGADPALAAAHAVLAWVLREGKQTFSGRDALNALRGRFRNMAALRPAFSVLEEHHFIRELFQEAHGPGRPRSALYEVSPHVRGKMP